MEAQTKREAVISEVRSQVRQQLTEAKAQLRAWEAQAEQVRRKLEADVISSAQAAKSKARSGRQSQRRIDCRRRSGGSSGAGRSVAGVSPVVAARASRFCRFCRCFSERPAR